MFVPNSTEIKNDSIQVSSTTSKGDITPAETIVPLRKQIDVKKSDFESLKIRSKIDFNSEKISQNFPATVQIRKDSIIWISVSVGLEAARGIIRQDSIFFIDRLNKHFYQFDFESLSNQLGFKLDYARIQSLLVGDLFAQQDENTVVEENGGFVFLKQKDNQLNIESVIDLLMKKLTRVVAQEEKSGEKLTITYNDITPFDKNSLPLKIDVSIDNTKTSTNTAKINIEYQKVEFLSRNINFPFSIPKSYTERFISTP